MDVLIGTRILIREIIKFYLLIIRFCSWSNGLVILHESADPGSNLAWEGFFFELDIMKVMYYRFVLFLFCVRQKLLRLIFKKYRTVPYKNISLPQCCVTG